ncbi:MAG: hypothetical protein ACJ8AP_15505 [Gemmatimonadales bacterium]
MWARFRPALLTVIVCGSEVSMHRLTALALSVSLLLGLSVAAPAQSPSAQPAEYLYLLTITVKSGSVPAYESFQKKIVAAAEKIGAPQHWRTWAVMIGGPGRTFNLALPFNKWNEIDGWIAVPQMLNKAYGEAEGRRILAAGTAVIENSETSVLRLLPGLSVRPEAFNANAGYIHLFLTDVEPGMVPAWESYIGKLKAAQEKSPQYPSVVRRVSVLGSSNTYATAVGFSNFAARDSWPVNDDVMRNAYGQTMADSLDGARLRATRNARQMVLMYRPELSRMGAGPAAASR